MVDSNFLLTNRDAGVLDGLYGAKSYVWSDFRIMALPAHICMSMYLAAGGTIYHDVEQ